VHHNLRLWEGPRRGSGAYRRATPS
jgi:hypothetical protein